MSTMCQFHLPQLEIKKHSEEQEEPDDGHELNLTALKKEKAHRLPLWCFRQWL